MLFDGPGLLLFVLCSARIPCGLVATESKVKPSDRTRHKKEVANEVIIQGVVEA